MSKISEELLDKVFDAEQKTVLLQLVKDAKDEAREEAEKGIKDRMAEEGLVEDEFLGLTKSDRLRMQHDAKAKTMKRIWENCGVHPTSGRKYSVDDFTRYDAEQAAEVMADTQFSTDQPLLIPRVVAQFVKEAIEPRIVLTGLLQRINYSGGTHITFPAMSGFHAADIAEGTEYPERKIEFGGEVTATIGKSGLAVKFTDEMLRYSQWDVMAMHLTAAGRALIRHKEKKVAAMISANATEDFNNTSGTATTGRAQSGAGNATFTLDDLLTMWAAAANAGWQPNALLMHPMGWLIFARDPVMRAFGFANGGPLWQSLQGSVGNAPQWKGGGFINQPWAVSAPAEIASTYTSVPAQFPFGPLKIIVSPYIGYTSTTNVTDIYLVDTDELGYLVVDEEATTEEFDDPARDIRKIKIRERYAVAGAIGSRIRKATDVAIAKGYDFDDLQVWQAGTGTLPTIS